MARHREAAMARRIAPNALAVLLSVLVAEASSGLAKPGHAQAVTTVTGCNSDDQAGAAVDLGRAITTGGNIVLDCAAGSVIRIARSHPITRDTHIDGGGRVVLDAGGTTAVFTISDRTVKLTLSNITIRNARPSGAAQGGLVSGAGVIELDNTHVLNTVSAINLAPGVVLSTDSEFADGSGTAIAAPGIELTRTPIHGSLIQPIRSSGATVTVHGGEYTGGQPSVFSNCQLIVIGAHFTGNKTGAIVSSCDTTLSGAAFDNNHAAEGAALLLQSNAPALHVRASHFSNNAADGRGGAISIQPVPRETRTIEVKNSTFRQNSAQNGGAIAVGGPGQDLDQSTLRGAGLVFTGNAAGVNGGAIAGTNAVVQLNRAVFAGNKAASGGAIALSQSAIRQGFIANSLFVRNTANSGSALVGSDLRLVNVTIAQNDGVALVPFAEQLGGFIKGHGKANLSLRNSALTNNGAGSCEQATIGANITDEGNNLQFPAAGCPASFKIADPGFDTLFVPALGGPAYDAGDADTCRQPPVSAVDLYGQHRPQGTGCTIGAVEGSIEDLVLRTYPAYATLPRTPPAPPSPTPTPPSPPYTPPDYGGAPPPDGQYPSGAPGQPSPPGSSPVSGSTPGSPPPDAGQKPY